MILQQNEEKRKAHEMIFTQERMRRIRLTKKFIHKTTEQKGETHCLRMIEHLILSIIIDDLRS